MKDKETQNNVFDILDKIEFFQGQRAGRELWNNKSKEVQDKDIADFIKDINYIRSYLQDSVVLSREEFKNYCNLSVENEVLKEEKEQFENDVCNYEMNLQHLTGELEQVRKETAEKILDLLVPDCKACDENWHSGCLCLRATLVEKIAKQFGLEIKE